MCHVVRGLRGIKKGQVLNFQDLSSKVNLKGRMSNFSDIEVTDIVELAKIVGEESEVFE